MLKVTIYDGPGGTEVSYIEGVTEPGGKRRVMKYGIRYQGHKVVIAFEEGNRKVFNGFRYIVDTIPDEKPI